MQTANLFQNGRNQAVRLPKEYQFEGKDVLIKLCIQYYGRGASIRRHQQPECRKK